MIGSQPYQKLSVLDEQQKAFEKCLISLKVKDSFAGRWDWTKKVFFKGLTDGVPMSVQDDTTKETT
ncbi:MAG: hypothetical protein JSV38_08920, partial [Desulfobacterales bacterium]